MFYVQPKDISTGEYDDKKIVDEKYWADIELCLSTENNEYLNDIATNIKIVSPT